MIGIVDYNAGNIKSVERALDYLKAPYICSQNPQDLKDTDRLIFPGVGDSRYAMEQLKATGFDSFLKDWVAAGKPLIGICLGSQIIFEYSEESDTQCLGLIKGKVRHISNVLKERLPSETEKSITGIESVSSSFKIPHMGFNDVTYCNGGSPLLAGVPDKSDFYFVHSYVIQPDDPTVIKGYATYGIMIPAIVSQNNITAFQFHPEKSGPMGMQILRNYTSADNGNSNGGASC